MNVSFPTTIPGEVRYLNVPFKCRFCTGKKDGALENVFFKPFSRVNLKQYAQ